MKIPYGVSDFALVRREGYFYADKTPFLPALESSGRYLVFLRPRRFGKSTLVSMMEHYYDVARRDTFEALFRGLWIHDHPTPEKNKHLVLTLDFSVVATDRGEEVLRQTFVDAVRAQVWTFLLRHRALVPELQEICAALDGFQNAGSLVERVFGAVAATPHTVYLMIDEYDHFANRLLASQQERLYEAVITKTGFVRTFYAALKAATRTGALSRLFVTGVSPLMLDDLSSGFNISTQASLFPRLATMAGLTRAEVEIAVDQFLRDEPDLEAQLGPTSRDLLLDVLEKHYNGYRFSKENPERVFNSDMVLYFLQQLQAHRHFPDNMLDLNVRTEYTHLQKIGVATGAGTAARRTLLSAILSEQHLRGRLLESFGLRTLATQTPFTSLLYYLGLLTLGEAPATLAGYSLEVPNRVIRELHWEHLAFLLEDDLQVDVNGDTLRLAIGRMAEEGDLRPFLEVFHRDVLRRVSVRDLRGLDEKTIKLLFMVYSSLGQAFYPLSEKEFTQGFCDLFLGANRHFVTAKYSWLLEFKYLPSTAKDAAIEKAFTEARSQVDRYLSDTTLLPLLVSPGGELRAGMLVFIGAKKILFRPAGPGAAIEVGGSDAKKPKRGKAGTAAKGTRKAAPKREALGAPRSSGHERKK